MNLNQDRSLNLNLKGGHMGRQWTEVPKGDLSNPKPMSASNVASSSLNMFNIRKWPGLLKGRSGKSQKRNIRHGRVEKALSGPFFKRLKNLFSPPPNFSRRFLSVRGTGPP